mgnify:CR=1 FL=1
MKKIHLTVALFIGFYNHQAWSVHSCSPLAEAAGQAYQVAEKTIAMPMNQTPSPDLEMTQIDRVGVWQIYQTEQDLFEDSCGPHPLTAEKQTHSNQSLGLAYPVLRNKLSQRFAVVNGRFLIKANDGEKLDLWEKQFKLKRILTLYDGETAVFQAEAQQDFAELLHTLQRQTGLISVWPILSEQRYRAR